MRRTGADAVPWRAGALALTLMGALLWPAAAGAIPASGPHETVDVTLSTTLPNTSAALKYSATYRNPADPQANPPALRRIAITGPPGTRADTSVPGRCPADDTQLRLMGEAACPADSRVGSGMATASTLGGPASTFDTTLFNADREQIELVKLGPLGAGVVRSTINGATIDGLVPTCLTGGQPPSGCPFDQIVLLSNHLSTVALSVGSGAARRDYLTTPPTCPSSGRWQTAVTLYYGDGSVETVVPQQPCTRAAAGSAPSPGHRHRRVHRRARGRRQARARAPREAG